MTGTWKPCLAGVLLALACGASQGASTSEPRLDANREQLAKALEEQLVLPDLFFHPGHLKLSKVRPRTGADFQAVEAEHHALLDSIGLSRLVVAPTSNEVLARLRLGSLIDVTEPSIATNAPQVEVRFTIEADWESWTQVPEAKVLFDFPESPRIGTAVLRLEEGAWRVDPTRPTATAPAPAECRGRCEESGRCEGSRPEQYPSYQQTRDRWSNLCTEYDRLGSVVAAECADGSLVLLRGGPFTAEYRYFDSSGKFVSWSSRSDSFGLTCFGQSYWPHPPRCRLAVVFESFCGEREPGSRLPTSRWLADPADDR